MFFDLNSTFRDLENLRKEIDSVFTNSAFARNSFPLINIYENDDQYTLIAELPGVTKENIDLSLNNNIITLSGQRNRKSYSEGTESLRKERNDGSFEKSFRLPLDVERDKIKAGFNEGLLTVTVPKAEAAKPKKITIEA